MDKNCITRRTMAGMSQMVEDYRKEIEDCGKRWEQYDKQIAKLTNDNNMLRICCEHAEVKHNDLCAEAAAMRFHIGIYCELHCENGWSENAAECLLCPITEGTATTAGAAMLRVVEAARQSNCNISMCTDCEHKADCQLKPIIAALADLEESGK
jgi:hypothetical protein